MGNTRMNWERTLIPVLLLAASCAAQTISPEIRARVDTKVKELAALSTDPVLIGAVKAHNAGLAPEEKAMTNEKWSQLTVLDPFVRTYTRNAAAMFLKSKRTEQIAECFVSGSDGTKVAFLSKTTSWSHADKEKHRIPMSGKVWVGPVALDESTGQQLVQVALPVLDAGKPIGSIVVGLAVSKLK